MYRRGIKVIASTSFPQGVVNQTLISDTPPESRTNGGTLRTGDRWWDDVNKLEYLWIQFEEDASLGGAWRPLS